MHLRQFAPVSSGLSPCQLRHHPQPKDGLANPPLNKLESQREWKSSTKRKAEEDPRDNYLSFFFFPSLFLFPPFIFESTDVRASIGAACIAS